MVHDFAKSVDALKADINSFLLSPSRWRSSKVTYPVSWSDPIPFCDSNKLLIPKEPGIYAFIVKHINNHFPHHGFIMYIGITGYDGNGRTLNQRYKEYLREQVINKRPKIHYMLTKFCDDIHFSYSVIDDTFGLEELEANLNDAIIPPGLTNDFSAEIRAVVKVIGL